MKIAREMMTAQAQSIGDHDTIRAAARKMQRLRVRALLVLDEDNRLSGMLTDHDLVVRGLANKLDPSSTPIRNIIPKGRLFAVDAGDSACQVMQTLIENKVWQVPVLENDELVGAISQADVAASYDYSQLGALAKTVLAET